jgi:hypothetical protein
VVGGGAGNGRMVDREDRDDVPAAIVCAVCGEADCSGCALEAEHSGVVTLLPWERPGLSMPRRLWATARAATTDADRFFESLPDGELAPALRFALGAELLAVASLLVVLLVIAGVLSPAWTAQLLGGSGAGLVLLSSVPLLSLLMVAAHAVHGVALHMGARRAGATGELRRALRFGLYACGWDLALSPAGALLALTDGAGALGALLSAGLGLPGRSTRAFLKGAYRLEGERASPALWAASIGAVVATLGGAVVVVAVALVVMLMAG